MLNLAYVVAGSLVPVSIAAKNMSPPLPMEENMDRRSFLSNMSAATVASIAGAATFSEKADAIEEAMSVELDKRIATP